MTTFKNILTVTVLLLATDAASAQFRCGVPLPELSVAERTTSNLDTGRFLDTVEQRLGNRFKGYAVIFTGSAGKRLGFTRAGFAIDPCDSVHHQRFDLNTETAIGSVTKLLTTVSALKVTTDHARFENPITRYLPFRWSLMAHPYYDTVSIADLLQHKAGFRESWEGEHISSRLWNGRELDTPVGSRTYSNTSMGIFHFIHAKWNFRAPYHETEVALQGASLDKYNVEIQKQTSKYYNIGLYNNIFRPLRISATCDPLGVRFPVGRPEYFTFHTVARSYSSRTADRGELLPNTELSCASGGVYMSAKDLAMFMTALDDPAFLPKVHRSKMINGGQQDDLWGFGAASGAEGGRSFVHNGLRSVDGNVSVAQVVRFPSGAHAVFVANSPWDGVNVQGALIDGYNAARR